MKPNTRHLIVIHLLFSVGALLLMAGCGTTQPASKVPQAGHFSSRYKATDGRIIVIGPRSMAKDGWQFKDPHLEGCWLAKGFDFDGYDTLYIAPTLSTAKLHGPQEDSPHAIAKQNLALEMNRLFEPIFSHVVTRESDIKPGAHVLTLQNTIVDYSKGGGAARYWAGLFGGGQPFVRVHGVMTDGTKTVFTFTGSRSGVSAQARLVGVYMTDEQIQLEDIRSLSLDMTDFVAAIKGTYEPQN